MEDMQVPVGPTSPLSSEWLSMMESSPREKKKKKRHSNSSSVVVRGRQTPFITPRGPLIAPKGAQRHALIAVPTERSWWSVFTENLSDELEAASLDGDFRDRKVHFDPKIITKPRETPATSEKPEANDSTTFFDLIQDKMCLMDRWEILEDRILNVDTPDDDNLQSYSDSEEESSVSSDTFSPTSTQSFDEGFSEQLVESRYRRDDINRVAKYKELLMRAEAAKKLKTMQLQKRAESKLKKLAAPPSQPVEKEWKLVVPLLAPKPPETEPAVTHADEGSAKAVEKNSIVDVSPLLKLTASFTKLTMRSDKKESSSISNESKKKELETKFRSLENLVQDDMSDISTKENGVPDLSSPQEEPLERRSRVEIRSSPAAWVAEPTVVSGLSVDENSSRQRATRLTLLPDETGGMMCSVPARLHNRIKAHYDRPPKLITTTPTSAQHQPNILSSSNTSLVVPGLTESLVTSQYVYDYDSRRQSYVAYFRRGPIKACKTIRLYEHPIPRSFPTLHNEVVVKVHVSTVTETDCRVRRGEYWGEGSRSPLNLPVVPGIGFYGQVVQMDRVPNRNGIRKDDIVTSLVRVGGNSRHLCIEYDRLVKVPSNIREPAAIACLPEIYLGAFQALHIDKKSNSRYRRTSLMGKSVLIVGGTSKTGRALVELALAAGSRTVYATASEKQYKIVEEAGGIPLSKNPNQWYSLLAGKMDLVICSDSRDSQRSELKYEHIQTLKDNGKMILFNEPEGAAGKIVELSKVDDQSYGTARKLYHYNVFDSWDADPRQSKRDLEYLLKLLAEDMIAPKIYERIPLSKVARAQEVIERTPLSGFILCEPWLKLAMDKNLPPQHNAQDTLSRVSGTTVSSASAGAGSKGSK